MSGPKKACAREDYVRPWLQQDGAPKKGATGCILSSRAWRLGTTFRSAAPKCPTADPNYRILARERSRCSHYYLLPARPRYWDPWRCAWGHFCLSRSPTISTAISLSSKTSCTAPGCSSAKTDNAFLWVADPHRPAGCRRRAQRQDHSHPPGLLDLGGGSTSSPRRDRQAVNLLAATTRCSKWSIAATLIFGRNFPIHKLFEGVPVKPGPIAAERRPHCAGLRAGACTAACPASWPASWRKPTPRPSCAARLCQKRGCCSMYEKFSTLPAPGGPEQQSEGLRLKEGSLDNLETVRRTLAAVTDRFRHLRGTGAQRPRPDPALFQRFWPCPSPAGAVSKNPRHQESTTPACCT